jgi:hypothetical protein
MKVRNSARETLPGVLVVLALAGSLVAFAPWAPAAAPENATGPELSASESDAAGSQVKSWWQQRQERRRARSEQYRQTIGNRAPQAPRKDASLSGALPADINVSFKLDPRITSGLYMGERWVSPPKYSGVQEGTFSVDARAQVLDAKGQSVDVNPEWMVADTMMVTVSPGRGKQVTITVHRAGESIVRVTVPAIDSEEPSVSMELAIKAWYQGTAIQAEISPSAVTKLARQRQSGPTVRNGWRYVDGDQPASGQAR